MPIFDRIIEYGILFLIVFTPLAFGTVHPWAYHTMELIICFLILIWALNQIIHIRQSPIINQHSLTSNSKLQTPNSEHSNSGLNRFGLVRTPLNIPIILFIGLMLFQLTPLPSGVLKFLSPNTHYLYSMAQPGWSEGNTDHLQPATSLSPPERQSRAGNSELQTLNSELLSPLSIYSYASKTELFKILAYIGMFFLITNTQGLRIKRIVIVIISVGFCISLLGILQKLTGTEYIYWVRDATYAIPFGPYVNRNHFAGYIGMVIPLALGLLVFRFAGITFYGNRDGRSIVAEFQSHFFANLLLIFIIVIMISALFLSLSRGGILSFAVVVVVFCTLVGLTRLRTAVGKGWRIMASVLIVTFIFLMWMGLDPILNRLSNISPGIRYDFCVDTIDMAKDFPLFGTGSGTFQYVFPGYKTLTRQTYTDHVHNDYLELLSDYGLVGFMIILSGFIMFFWKTLTRWWERRHHYAKGVAMGGICGIIAILAHSFTDFNLHIPANALFLSILLGLTHNVVNMKR